MAINADAERAILYREFCEWCNTVPHLELDPRLHTHSGRIEDGGYISNGVTAKAFAAWKAARCAPAAPQPQADARDAERWRFIKRKLCLTGNGDGTCAMQALNLPARILGWPDVGELAIAKFLDGAIDAAIAAAKGKSE